MLSSGSSKNSAFVGLRSRAATVTLSVVPDKSTFSPISAELLSITILIASDAPTAVLSPLELLQLPGSLQVASDASAIAHALETILFVEVEVTPTFCDELMVLPLPIFAN